VQISSLQSSRSLPIHLRTCPRRVSHAEWHRHSMSTQKVRPILSQVANRYLLPVVRFAQVVERPAFAGLYERCRRERHTLEHPRLRINRTRIFL
jgi:hypothetical protein